MGLWLLETDANVVGLILRCTLAVVMFPHGAQKVLGWFGGQGLTSTLQFFTSAGIPPVLTWLAIAAETFEEKKARILASRPGLTLTYVF